MLKWGMIRFSISLALWEREENGVMWSKKSLWLWMKAKGECIERKQTLQCPCLEKVLLCYSVFLAPCMESVGQIHSRACFPELHLFTEWATCFLHVTCLEARPVAHRSSMLAHTWCCTFSSWNMISDSIEQLSVGHVTLLAKHWK